MSQSNIQVRTFDPYGDLNSDILNRFTSVLVPGGRAIITGLECTITNPNVVTVSKGIAVKERVIIEYLDQVELTVDTTQDVYYYIVLSYNFHKSCPPPEAEIRVIPVAQYNQSSDLLLNVVRVDNGQLVSVLHCDPLNPSRCREEITLIDEKIEDHNVDPNAHPDIRSMIGGGTGSPTQIVLKAGQTLSAGDPVAIINNEAVKATNDQTQGLSLIQVIGIATGNANTGDDVTVQTSGIYTNSAFNFSNSASTVVFLDDGFVTDILPTNHSVVIVGYKTDTNSLYVNPHVQYIR